MICEDGTPYTCKGTWSRNDAAADDGDLKKKSMTSWCTRTKIQSKTILITVKLSKLETSFSWYKIMKLGQDLDPR